ncbi:type I-E CRISPR-associated protein Cas6/Cse3/CasE [Mycetocola tolaasinivorans]|uniref:Type I-E CRISPR-associated protein Cas6/Cse3/CasE n=1 Tax=Mycetocola tolaasinivorans TaxID=76635 RepID=A0A3L7A3M0_9MICO|nr:type I-E CRISPR-associated protein Cas6/Cse3/CasE [Mycetocola tolaasinivorans]RLP74943.1 type I-E CRISPR-associated protein Cas6/Cse3/CasE [Mycetocola tolaasinivorans]
MYLTRFQLNPHRRRSRALLGSPQVMHAAVLACFPDASPTDAGRVLWRVDGDGEKSHLYVVSPARPDLTTLVEEAGWPTLETWETRAYDGLLGRLDAGQRWAFRLTANPVHSLPPAPGEKRGKRFAHVTVAQQLEWLGLQAERCGFRVGVEGQVEDEVIVSRRKTITFVRQKSTVTLGQATFDGLLEITNRELFVRALGHGIGPAKGYGCGLLTLAPVV